MDSKGSRHTTESPLSRKSSASPSSGFPMYSTRLSSRNSYHRKRPFAISRTILLSSSISARFPRKISFTKVPSPNFFSTISHTKFLSQYFLLKAFLIEFPSQGFPLEVSFPKLLSQILIDHKLRSPEPVPLHIDRHSHFQARRLAVIEQNPLSVRHSIQNTVKPYPMLP